MPGNLYNQNVKNDLGKQAKGSLKYCARNRYYFKATYKMMKCMIQTFIN